MKRFILRTLLLYTLLSIVISGCVIYFGIKDKRESRYPRKTLYVVNRTNDTISIQVFGVYTKAEKRALNSKPDQDTFYRGMSTLPYEYATGAVRQATAILIPHKRDCDIQFPQDFAIHIHKQEESISLSREEFFQRVKGKSSDNTWVLYID